MIRRPPRSTQSRSSAASDVYKRQQKTPQFFRPTYHWQNAGLFGIFVPGDAKSQGFLQGSSDFHIRGQPERLPAAGFSWWAHQDFLGARSIRPSGASAEKYAPFVGALRLRIGEVSGRRAPRDFPPFAEHPNFRSISPNKKKERYRIRWGCQASKQIRAARASSAPALLENAAAPAGERLAEVGCGI